ncbi:uncharacterized protein dpr21 isoform X4 [Drosophila takahashii]|uniref:uncharacterized protein dpr21 isoform X4 n=1 Tax=Drosophila takahashii TaxID=29030 RepID=UPI003898EB4E
MTPARPNVSELQLILRKVTTLKHCLQVVAISYLNALRSRLSIYVSVSIQSAENHIMERIMGLLTDQVGNLAGVMEQLNQRVVQLEVQLSRRGDQLEGDVEGVPALMVKVDQLEAKLQANKISSTKRFGNLRMSNINNTAGGVYHDVFSCRK